MSPLYLWNGKLLMVDGALAGDQNCCCGDSDSDSPPYGSDSDIYGEPYSPDPPQGP